jgi:hypothetical protein
MRRIPRLSSAFALAALVGLGAGCPSREVAQIDPRQQKEEYKEIPITTNRKVDILFVIDNSGSMAEEQASLLANFGSFMNVLESIEGGLPDVHIGVVSSDTGIGYTAGGCNLDGDNGRLQNTARIVGCSPPSGYFIKDVQTTPPAGTSCEDNPDACRDRNYDAEAGLAATFSCIARIGTTGCGLEQHLEGMKRALDGRNPENAGFLRPDAYLAVILLADEDDCSAKNNAIFNPDATMVTQLGPFSSYRCTEFGIQCRDDADNVILLDRSPRQYSPPNTCEPRGAPNTGDNEYFWHPQHYVDFLRSLKPDPENSLIVATIVGNPTPVAVGIEDSGPTAGNPKLLPSCQSANGVADPAVRLKWFSDQFPNRNAFVSICNDDLSDGMDVIAKLLKRVVGNPCIEGRLDVTDLDPNEPGLQIDCSVSDVRHHRTDDEEQYPVPRCKLQEDPASPGGVKPRADSPRGGIQNDACWYVYEDLQACGDYPSKLVLKIDRLTDAPTGTTVIARCAIE